MKKNQFILSLMLASGLLCAASAMADVKEPEAYLRLTAFESFSPAQAPQLQGGQHTLSNSETRYREKLPVQLGAAMKRVTRSDYRTPKFRENLRF